MSDFIADFLDYSKHFESPTSFWKWAGYAAVAATLKDSVYWVQGSKKMYPNMYVLLMADSAMHRKGTPVKEVLDLVGKIKHTKVISGRGSIQAILEELSMGSTDPFTGKPSRGGSCLLCFEELAASFVLTPEVIHILTDIYEFKEEYKTSLKGGSGSHIVHNLCVSMLAASNEFLLKDVYNTQAVYGGLLGRTFVIKADEFRQGNALLTKAEDKKFDTTHLTKYLVDLGNVRGRVVFEPAGIKEYEDWYLPLRDRYKNNPDRTGVIQRIHTGVIKLALVICAIKTHGLIVGKDHIEEAIDECTKLLGNYEVYAMTSGKSTIAQAGSLFLNELWEKGGLSSRKDIMRKFWTEFDSEILDKLVQSFEEAGFIKRGFDGTGETYHMTDRAREIFQKGREKKPHSNGG